jgi:Short C-terminal domain/Domain of unknwon function (DUF3824)
MFRRRRPLARAAMVGGAAYYAGKKVEQGRQSDADTQYRLDELEAQQAGDQYAQPQYAPPPPAAPAPPAAGGGITSETLARLEQLAELKDKGVLSEDEFEVQKRRLLGTA